MSERIVKGILGTKLGMTQLWDENNKVVPVTVIQAGPCVVTQVRTPEQDGYNAVQLGFGAVKAKKVTKPEAGHFAKADVTPRKHLVELRTADASEFELGQELTAEVFADGEIVDVTGTSKGKGTAGVMKRHGFHGLRASHGVHRKHRSPGSIGGCATPGRVFKGLRMAGRMGNNKVTVQNLKIHAVDAERGDIIKRIHRGLTERGIERGAASYGPAQAAIGAARGAAKVTASLSPARAAPAPAAGGTTASAARIGATSTSAALAKAPTPSPVAKTGSQKNAKQGAAAGAEEDWESF